MSRPFDRATGDAVGEAVQALRRVQDLMTASRPDPATSAAVTGRLAEIASLLAPFACEEESAIAGRLHPVPGRGHPFLPELAVDAWDADRLTGRVVLTSTYLGTRGAHGGTLPLLFDEAFGMLANTGDRAYARTAFLHVDYRAVTPLDRELTVEARFDREEGRKRFLTGRLLDGDVLLADASALFVVLREGQR